MDKVLAIANLVLSLLPLIISAIKQIEAAFPGSGLGDKKLTMLLQILEESGSSVDGFRDRFNDAVPAIQRVVSFAVSLFNNTGEFKK